MVLERRNQGRSRLLDQTDQPGGDLSKLCWNSWKLSKIYQKVTRVLWLRSDIAENFQRHPSLPTKNLRSFSYQVLRQLMTAIIFKIQIINNYLDNDFHSKYCSEDIIKVSQHLQTPKEIQNIKQKGGTKILDKPCVTIDTARKRIYVINFGSNFFPNSRTEKSTSIPPPWDEQPYVVMTWPLLFKRWIALFTTKIYPVDNVISFPNTYPLHSDLSGG